MKLVLVRKLANEIDGIDLTGSQVGDTLELTHADARLLAAEGWGVVERRRSRRQRSRTDADAPAAASDMKRRRRG